MGVGKRVFGDVMFPILVKAKKGESIWHALERQGREVRQDRRRAFKKATKSRRR